MAEEVHGGGFRRWNIPYRPGQLVRWTFYDWDKIMTVTSTTQNSVTMRAFDNPEFMVIEYEDGIDDNVQPL